MSRRRGSSTSSEVERLRARVADLEGTIQAIQSGGVDALVTLDARGGKRTFSLRGADHRYRQLIEVMSEGAGLLGRDGVIVYGNHRLAEMVGAPLEKLLGAPIGDFVLPEHRARVDALLQPPAGQASKAEVELLTATGARRPAYFSITAIPPEVGEGLCLIATDLSEQKRTSELVATERLASLILEQVTEPIVVCDRDGRVIRASRPVHRLCQQNPLLQSFAQAFPFRHASGCTDTIDVVEQALAGHTSSGVEAVLDRDDGQLSLLLSAGPLTDAQGAVIGCVVAMTDVTAQRRADLERERLLEAAERARRQAEAASRAKDEFMAILGHELRNPLAPISTALQVMQLRGSSVGEREREVIERQVAHLVRLVDDLLDLSRITRGKLGLKKQRIHLPDAIHKAIEMASPLLEERHHEMEVHVTPGLWVLGDPHRLAQVFSNLLCNAAKYTEPRGRITVRADRDEGAVVVSIQDNGIGIRPDLLPQVFDLFVQGQRRVERAQGGLGLGLSLVKSLVTMHGGRVAAHSDGPGAGSRFEVRLPLARPLEGQVPTEVRTAPRPASRQVGRVLVVDDNPDAADLLAEALEACGYQVAVSHDGPGALLAAREFQPEVGVLDIGLPVMDGYELARRLREQMPGVRLVALTGYGQDADRRRSHEAGFAAHLVKPVDLTALVACIERAPARPGTRPKLAAAAVDEPTSQGQR